MDLYLRLYFIVALTLNHIYIGEKMNEIVDVDTVLQYCRLGIFTECQHCGYRLDAEHAHYKCRNCGWRDSCCD